MKVELNITQKLRFDELRLTRRIIMNKILTGFLTVFLLTAFIKPQKAEAGLVVLSGLTGGAGAVVAGLVFGFLGLHYVQGESTEEIT
jgi:hypothetical protein